MGTKSIGWTGAEAYVLGGILGSGLFSILGVVVLIAGSAAWLAYLLAGVVAVCTSYSYVQLNAASEFHGGVVTLVLEQVGRPAIAGMIGWVLLTGFIGVLGMYGYAFGAYAEAFFGDYLRPFGLPLRPLFSTAVIAVFVLVNRFGPTQSGRLETAIVGLNALLVPVFGSIAAWHIHAAPDLQYVIGVSGHSIDRLGVAAAAAFVSLVAWQILMYDQSRLRHPVSTVKRTVGTSLPVAILGYALLSVLLTSLLHVGRIGRNPELVLVIAAESFSGMAVTVLIGSVALGATAAAVNAVLFSTTLFLQGLISYRLFPDATADMPTDELPPVPLLIVGGTAICIGAFGRIETIVQFAALAFTATNGIISYLALRDDRTDIPWMVPLVGLLGSGLFVAFLFRWLLTRKTALLVAVGALGLGVVALELLYVDREAEATDGR
ncbi:MAG: APC family permease [Halodesulfurarchaeum sp.]